MNAVLHVNVRLLACSLEVLDGCIAAQPSSDVTATTTRGRARGLASELLTVHVPSSVERYATTLLTSLFTSRSDYYSHKVINSRDMYVCVHNCACTDVRTRMCFYEDVDKMC